MLEKRGSLFKPENDISQDLFCTRTHTKKSRFLNTVVPKLANV